MNNHNSDLSQLYLKAKKSYYKGEPIMSDTEFDKLENNLASQGLLNKIVGFDDEDRNAKFNHPSKMLSLAKLQAYSDGTPPTEHANKWLNNLNQDWYEATPKFDGNAINVIYRNGKLDAILSRGNGSAGRDYTEKLIGIIPQTIKESTFDTVEVRGEIVIKTNVFNEKYSQFKNERNFVAGILNRDEDVSETTSDFTFMAVEAKGYIKGKLHHTVTENLNVWGFNQDVKLFTYIFGPKEFELVYKSMKHYREFRSPFRLDGFVIKTPENSREKIGENSHDPNWAIAIKFPPEEAITTVKRIQWNFGKTGQLTPVAILEPVLLDGSTVQRASVHNYGWMIKKGCVPGAVVTIAKKGDIIPQIISIKTPSQKPYTQPTHCSKCDTELEIVNDLHLQCPNDGCGGVDFLKFLHSFNLLGIDGTAGAMIKKIYESGFTQIGDVLNKKTFTIENLTKPGILKRGKTLQKMFDQISEVKELPLHKIVKFMGIENLGNSIAKQVSNKIAGIDYSFKSLDKSVCKGWDVGEERYENLMKLIQKVQSNGIEVIYPEAIIIAEDTIKYEMTGSPKAFGFKTKKEFIDYATSKGWVHTKLNEADKLITDNVNGSSSKMKSAAKKGIEIILYSQV